jgi:hypothetical protein
MYVSAAGAKRIEESVRGAFGDGWRVDRTKAGAIRIRRDRLFAGEGALVGVLFEASDKDRFAKEFAGLRANSPEAAALTPPDAGALFAAQSAYFNAVVTLSAGDTEPFVDGFAAVASALGGYVPGKTVISAVRAGGREVFVYDVPETEENTARRLASAARFEGGDPRASALALALPVLPDAMRASRRDDGTVAKRALALAVFSRYCYEISGGADLEKARERALRRLSGQGVSDCLTEDETRFLHSDIPDMGEALRGVWAADAAAALFWSIGMLDMPDVGSEPCDITSLRADLPAPEETATLPLRRVLDMADLTYRLNCLCLWARLKSVPNPLGADHDVTAARDGAFRWLLGG